MVSLHRRRNKASTEPAIAEPDALLVARARADLEAFAPLYDRYFAQVYHYCLAELHDPLIAEDTASQTFLRAMSALPSYQETGRFRAWLFAVAHNAILNAGRGRAADTPLDAVGELPDSTATPEELAIGVLDLAAVDAATVRLSLDHRRVIELRRAGLTGREIAAALGITYEAAKKRQLRAMDQLEAALQTANQPSGGRRGH